VEECATLTKYELIVVNTPQKFERPTDLQTEEGWDAPGWTLSLTSLQKGMQVAKHWKSVYLLVAWW
jgi:hypothetical protein